MRDREARPVRGASGRRPSAGRRADAERNIAAIVDAGLAAFDERPDASMVAIARAAGVSRVTLYAHFPSREALLEAVLERAVAEASVALDAEAVERGPAREALAGLVRSSWRTLDRHRRLYAAASHALSAQRLRERHRAALEPVERLVARGRVEGVFRTDLPEAWLVTVFYSLLHAAAEEVDAGRLRQKEAADVLVATVLSVLAPRGAG